MRNASVKTSTKSATAKGKGKGKSVTSGHKAGKGSVKVAVKRELLDNVFVGAYNMGYGIDGAIRAVQKAGAEQGAVRLEFKYGLLAWKLFSNLKDTKSQTAQERQTAAVKALLKDKDACTEPFIASAIVNERQAWSRLLKKAEVKSQEKRGTKGASARKGKGGKGKGGSGPAAHVNGSTPSLVTDATPAIKTPEAYRDVVKADISRMFAFAQANAKHQDAAYYKIVRDAHAAMILADKARTDGENKVAEAAKIEAIKAKHNATVVAAKEVTH